MTPFSLSFQKDSRPRTLAVDPLDFDLFIQCLVTADHPGSKQQSQMHVLGLQPSTWDAEVGISRVGSYSELQSETVSECQKKKKPNETKIKIPGGDWILMTKLS